MGKLLCGPLVTVKSGFVVFMFSLTLLSVVDIRIRHSDLKSWLALNGAMVLPGA